MNLRDKDLQDIVFVDQTGNSKTVKAMREYPSLTTWFTYNMNQGDEIDEIASRKDVYGDGGEGQYYRIAWHNIAELFDVQFDVSQLRTLNIPMP
jgi:hypothetical protein